MQAALLFEPAQIDENPIELGAENAGWLRRAPGMPALTAISNDLRASLARQSVGIRAVVHRNFADRRIREYASYENITRELIPDDAVTALAGIGIPPYYLAQLTVIDTAGLADAVVARNPVVSPNHERLMAHDRRPPLGYLVERGVNITVLPATSTAQYALHLAAYAVQIGPELWMPFDSVDPQWVRQHFGDSRTLRVSNETIIDSATLPRTRQPAIRSTYDVYHIGQELIYVKYDCQRQDITTPFFLHITPTDLETLPQGLREVGFDNLDFTLDDYDVASSGTCARTIALPHYPIAAIRTGQYNEQGRLWEGEIRLEQQ